MLEPDVASHSSTFSAANLLLKVALVSLVGSPVSRGLLGTEHKLINSCASN